MQGRITKFFADRHYGWIHQLDNGRYWFFHLDDVVGVPNVEKGALVQFEAGKHQGKDKAVNVRKLTAIDLLSGSAR